MRSDDWTDGLLIRVNPSTRKGQTMAKKNGKKSGGKKPAANEPKRKASSSTTTTTTTTTKRTTRKKRNPSEVEKAKKSGLKALALAGGALFVEAVDKLLVPIEYRSGITGAIVRAGTSLAVGKGLEFAPTAVAKYADDVRDGGLAMAIFLVGAEKALPMIPSDVVVGKLLGVGSGAAPLELEDSSGIQGRKTYALAKAGMAGRATFRRAGVGSIGGGGSIGTAGAPWARRMVG